MMKAGKETLVVASSSNERFAMGLLVLLCSMVMNNRESNIRFYIINDDILPDTKKLLIEKVTKLGLSLGVTVEIRVMDLSQIKIPDLPLMKGGLASYARLFFSEVLEESSIYYVDSDMVCNRSFPPLAEMESEYGGFLLAGCRDDESYIELDKVWAGKGGRGLYVNAGFLWMNLQAMRDENLPQRVREGKDIIEGIRLKVTPYHDQTLFNCHCMGRIAELPQHFNVVGVSLRPDAVMNPDDNWHFTGEVKPWLAPGDALHLTKSFYVYHVIMRKLGLEGRLPYSAPCLPLSNYKYMLRHIIAARLWFRSKNRFRRFMIRVRCHQGAKSAAAAYSDRIDSLLWKA